ncbi:MAG: hypothetical protein KDD69_12405, partial [Bdellovibrionales bacterium]|nr:hypothetical protein [Bdellovibrionales bacterium]
MTTNTSSPLPQGGSEKKEPSTHFRRTLVAGVLTLIPLWITWFVLKFVFAALSDIGAPAVRATARALRSVEPTV